VASGAGNSTSLDGSLTAGSDPDPFPLVNSLETAHKLGCHHVTASQDGKRFVSVGFGGEVKIWDCESGDGITWVERKDAVFGDGGENRSYFYSYW
jgi:superkiller protein 8